jgi:hypothetical protein
MAREGDLTDKAVQVNMASTEIHDGPLEEMEAMQLDEPTSDNTVGLPTLQLSEKESQILELFDRLEEVKLEISLLEAQENVPNGRNLSPLALAFSNCILII